MKPFGIAIIGLALVAGLASAQPPPPAPAVYLQVKRLTTAKETSVNWKTSYGSYDKEFSRALAISIFLRNMQKEPAPVTLEWFFIAKELSTRQQYIFDKGAEELVLDHARPYQTNKISMPITAQVQRYMSLGMSEKSGSQISGYLVRVRAADKILAVDASSKPLEKTGERHLDLREVLAEAIPAETVPFGPVDSPLTQPVPALD